MGAIAASLVSRIAPLLIAAAGAFVFGMVLMHKFDLGEIEKIKLADAQAHAAAVAAAAAQQKAYDDNALAAATEQAVNQNKLATALQQELNNVKAHVSNRVTVACIPYGLIRVLYAGERGVGADTLPLPAGKSDDACTSIGWADLAAAILHDYGNARANAQQLDGLVALLKKQGVAIR